MGRPYEYQCLDVRHASTGTMVCATCGTPIIDGEFLSYKKTKDYDWYYVTHHRSCSSDHPLWKQYDKLREDAQSRLEALQAAAAEFYQQWGVADLRDYLPEWRDYD